MLVKDPRLRPSISSVIKRFEHVHALLVVTGPPNFRFGINKPYMTETTLVQSLEESLSMLNLDHDKRINLKQLDKMNKNVSQIYLNSITPINENISYCSKHYLKSKKSLFHLNITHIVSMTSKDELAHLTQQFDILYLKDHYRINNFPQSSQKINYHKILALITDFFRKSMIRKGKILFVEEDELLDTTSPKSLVGEYIILALSRITSKSAYEVYTSIRTKNPLFDIDHENLRKMSRFCQKQLQIQNYLKGFPTLECLWGAWWIILKRQFGNLSNMYSTSWSWMGARSFESTSCPSPGCFDFIMYLRKINPRVKHDRLKWGYLGREDFVLGPKKSGIIHQSESQETQRQILTSSLTIDENWECLETTSIKSTERETQWVTYKWKYCYVWMYSYNQEDDWFAVLMNNQTKYGVQLSSRMK